MSPLLVMSTALVLNLIGFANYAAVLPDVRAGVGLSEAQAGLAGGAFFLAYALGSPIFASLTDSRDPRRLYSFGTALGVAGGLVFPRLHDGFAALMLGRILTGLGMAGIYMPGLRLLIETLPVARQSRAAGIYVSTLTLGLSASFGVSGGLQWVFGWQAAFLGAAAAAAAALLLVRAAMPALPMQPADGGLLRRFAVVLRGRGVWLLLLAIGGNSWEGMAFRTWWVALLGFSLAQPGHGGVAGVNLAVATAFTGLLAMPLSAYVARRAEAGRRHRVIAAAAASSVLVGAALALCLAAPFAAVFALSVAYVCAIFSDAGALTPALLARVPQEGRGAALALQTAASNISACAAVVTAGLVLQAAGGAESLAAWRWTVLVIAAGSAMTAGCMAVVERGAQREGRS